MTQIRATAFGLVAATRGRSVAHLLERNGYAYLSPSDMRPGNGYRLLNAEIDAMGESLNLLVQCTITGKQHYIIGITPINRPKLWEVLRAAFLSLPVRPAGALGWRDLQGHTLRVLSCWEDSSGKLHHLYQMEEPDAASAA